MINLDSHGASIPAIGLGTWRLSGPQCTVIVRQALAAGYTHIDTAIMYENEVAVGEGLRSSGKARGEYFLTTKVWPTEVTEGAFQEAVQGSLSRLGVDEVDLLLIHWPPKEGNAAEWAGLINQAAEKGWTRHIGVSNFTSSQLDAITEASDRPIVCNQIENHPYLDQSIMRAACKKHDLALIAYCPLSRGGELFSAQSVVDAAFLHGKTPAQVVLRWHLQHSGCGAIPKTSTPERLLENIDIFDFELSVEEMEAITGLARDDSRICDFEFSPVWD